MGPLEIALALYGMVGASVSIAKEALSELNDFSSRELFVECFTRSAHRHAKELLSYTDTSNPNALVVNSGRLREALVGMETADVSAEDLNKDQMLAELSPHFRGTIVLGSLESPAQDFSPALELILEDALADFFAQLPLSTVAYREAVIDHIQTSAEERREQKAFREQVNEQLDQLIELQEEVSEDSTYLNPTKIQKESSWEGYNNPFRMLKAEDFSDSVLLADLFREPSDYDTIRGWNNLILEGGRGCGKSMILRSLAAPVALEIESEVREQEVTSYGDSSLNYFGVYIKLVKGCFDDCAPGAVLEEEAARTFFQHYFNMELLKATLETVMECRDASHVNVTSHQEQRVCSEIAELIGGSDREASTFSELLGMAKQQGRHISDYLLHLKIGGEPNYDGELTEVYNFPEEFCSVLTEHIPGFQEKRIYFLLDEFENLRQFQQTVVNTIVTLRPPSLNVKVATRALGVKSGMDLQGEPIQNPRDYEVITLDYVPTEKKYLKLLADISKKRLQQEGYEEIDVEELLPGAGTYSAVEGGKDAVEEAVGEHVRKHHQHEWSELSDDKKSEYVHRMGVGYVFRINSRLKEPQDYSGFENFAILSSGIISNYLEMCRMAFYLAQTSDVGVRQGNPIPRKLQNRAVYLTSEESLNRIPRNIPTTGSLIGRFVQDLAAVFRKKLQTHPSEPEAAKVVVADPEKLGQEDFSKLQKVLEDAVRWSVLHFRTRAGSYLPKHISDAQPRELLFNRMYAPALKISHRPRWRTKFAVQDLAHLVDEEMRGDKKRELVRRHSGRKDDELQQDLFEGEQETAEETK